MTVKKIAQPVRPSKADKLNEITRYFENKFPNPKTELEFESPFQLLVSTLLAAQCTDKRVNMVTAELFRVAPTPQKMLKLSQDEVENYIRSVNYYKTKAKHILETCERLVNDFGGEVPDNLDDLQTLPGVGRKTASVVLVCAFEKPAFPVDTHVFRVSNRLGLIKGKDVKETETKLCRLLDPSDWYRFHHYFILHGRYICKAQTPDCVSCGLTSVCSYFLKKQ
jgi:endonuclease-3